MNEQTLQGGGAGGRSGVEIEDPAVNAEMTRLKEQLFLARKDLICAQVMQQRWKDTLLQLKQVNANPERAVEPIDMAELRKVQEENEEAMGIILDMTLEQVEMSHELDQ